MDKKQNAWNIFYYVIIAAMAVLLLCEIGLRFFFFEVEVVGSSMAETLSDGETLIVNRYGKAERGRIVIIDVPDRLADAFTGETLVKRIVAIEGDTVCCRSGVLYLKKEGETDFTPIQEDYVSSKTPNFSEVTLEEGEIYCLGDNRAFSKDSTEVGPFSITDLHGYLDENGIRLSRAGVWSAILKFLI